MSRLGEGSRGGKIIGHTRSGKPIYSKYGHRLHKDFTMSDHLDAYHIHENLDRDDNDHFLQADHHFHASGLPKLGFSDDGGGWFSTRNVLIVHRTDGRVDVHDPEGTEESDRGVIQTHASIEDALKDKRVIRGTVANKSGEAMSNDIFKAMGITVGEAPSLLRSTQEGATKEADHSNQIVRKGFAGNARDRLEGQLSKGFSLIELIAPQSRHAQPSGTYGEENLKNTHGEEFHTDNDKDVESMVTSIGEVDRIFEDEYVENPLTDFGTRIGRERKEPSAIKRSYSFSYDDLIKAGTGEGSKGGKIIGHTQSGKPIYASAGSANHKGFTKQDHIDAALTHSHLRSKAGEEYHAQHNGDGTYSNKHAKKKAQLKKVIEHHHNQAARHRDKAEPSVRTPDQRDFDRMDRKNDGGRSRASMRRQRQRNEASHAARVGVSQSPEVTGMPDTPRAPASPAASETSRPRSAAQIRRQRQRNEAAHSARVGVSQSPEITGMPVKKSLTQEDLLLKALDGIGKCTTKGMPRVSTKAPRLEKDPEQIKEEKQQKKQLLGKWAKKSDSLIEMVEDRINPSLIANVHENYEGVSEKLKPGELLERSELDELVDVIKAGEGSRGGKIIGHTRSGKPIYANKDGGEGFSKEDHKDAAALHKVHSKAGWASSHERAAGHEFQGQNPAHDHIQAHGLTDKVKPRGGESATDKNRAARSQMAARNAQDFKDAMTKKSCFIKSYGPGGVIFDFGSKTGNKIADNATALLNAHGDPVQQSNAQYQSNAYEKALSDYVTKGDSNYSKDATPFGNINNDWSDQLNKSTDQQVVEAFQKGQLSEDRSTPAVMNDHNKTEINMGGNIIKATSETDAALLKMMQESGADLSGMDSGMVVDASAGGAQRVMIDATA